MIQEIIDAVTEKLHVSFPDAVLRTNRVKQNLKNDKDNFSILINQPTKDLENMYSYNTTYPVQIIYFPHEELINKSEVYAMFDGITEAIGFDLPVDEDIYILGEFTTQEIDEELHVLFDVEISTPIMKYDPDLQNELMEELILNRKVGE